MTTLRTAAQAALEAMVWELDSGGHAMVPSTLQAMDDLRDALDEPQPEPVSDFQEGQWWLQELDALVKDGTHDQKRAVAVVRNLMSSANAQPEPFGEVVIGENGFTKGWTVVKWRKDLPPIAVGTKLYAHPPRQPVPRLTDADINKHAMLAKDCPPNSAVMLVSSIRRLQSRAVEALAHRKQGGE